eukprot:8245429-Alexandrium_andersonii.AAC.1
MPYRKASLCGVCCGPPFRPLRSVTPSEGPSVLLTGTQPPIAYRPPKRACKGYLGPVSMEGGPVSSMEGRVSDTGALCKE